MHDGKSNPGERRHGEYPLDYIERQFMEIREELSSDKERLKHIMLDIQGLNQDEEILAQAIPFLVNEVTTLQAEKAAEQDALNTKISELTAKEAEVAADATALAQVQTELATARGELSQVEQIVGKLDPVAKEAEKVLPKEAPAPEATEPTQPVYTFTPGEGVSPDSRFNDSGFQAPAAADGSTAAVPVLYFSGDTPNQTLTATGGTVPGYTLYTGATEAVPAPAAGGDTPAV